MAGGVGAGAVVGVGVVPLLVVAALVFSSVARWAAVLLACVGVAAGGAGEWGGCVGIDGG